MRRSVFSLCTLALAFGFWRKARVIGQNGVDATRIGLRHAAIYAYARAIFRGNPFGFTEVVAIFPSRVSRFT